MQGFLQFLARSGSRSLPITRNAACADGDEKEGSVINFCLQAWNKPITGTATHYSSPMLNSQLAQADKFFVTARVQQVSGTSPQLSVVLQHSSDGENWTDKATPINQASISSDNTYSGSDLGTSAVAGCFMRVAITLSGSSPSAAVDVRVTGRSEGA